MRDSRRRASRIPPLVIIAILSALLWFTVVPTVKARFFRAPRVIHVGSSWGSGYVAMPQRAGIPPQIRKAQGERAALLARQRGLAIVADGDASDVAVIQMDRGNK